MQNNILVTGGSGFIGSHTVVELLAAGYTPIILDNLCNSDASVIGRIQELTGQAVTFIQGDVRDPGLLEEIFSSRAIEAVIHFAGLKAVGESVTTPLPYFDNNLTGTLNLLTAMQAAGCRNLVFSSSATVYGDTHQPPFTEDMTLSATSPYGRTKVIIEDMCRDLAASEPGWHIALLRYFNPVGAHPSGLLGEDPKGTPNNLMPYLVQVAAGLRPELSIFGNDYPTPDGTAVRDYIHVVDLARGHMAALEHLPEMQGAEAINLGTGQGCSVLEMVTTFQAATGQTLATRMVGRRAGDIACSYAATGLAQERLGWKAGLGLEAMCQDAWRWQDALS